MRIHCFQQVPFETPAYIADWASQKSYPISFTKFFEQGYTMPGLDDFDVLVVMGGPMGVYDNDEWIKEEQAFVKLCIESGKYVIGICLGAQFIAQALGAKVYKGEHEELGWFPINLTAEAETTNFFGFGNGSQIVFHWHGDTFDIPEGAVRLAYSECTPNQAFLYKDKVLALQFHFEGTYESIEGMLQAIDVKTAADNPFVQSAGSIRKEYYRIADNNRWLSHTLDHFLKPLLK